MSSYYHTKFGIFTDTNGDRLAFSGSINEPETAWTKNYESFLVVFSWDVALEGSARWPELAGMLIGQLLIVSMLLIVRRHKPAGDPDLFGSDSAHSSAGQDHIDQIDPP